MKKIILTLSVFCTLMIASTMNAGAVVAQELKLDGIDVVSFGIKGELYISQSDTPSIKIDADNEVLGKVDIQRNKNVLTVGPKDTSYLFGFISIVPEIKEPVKIHLALPNISNIICFGDGRVLTESALSGETITINGSASGYVDIELNYKTVNIQARNSAKITLTGKTDEPNLSLINKSTFAGKDLKTLKSDITTSDGTSAEVNVSEEITTNQSGKSTITVYGEPINRTMSEGSNSEKISFINNQ